MIDGLRWIKVDKDPRDDNAVRGVIPGWEGLNTYYKLQYLDLSGFWRDVEIDRG